MLVAEKKNTNFDIVMPVFHEFDRIAKTVGNKQKWAVITAAVLAFLELSDEAQAYIAGQVIMFDGIGKDFDELIAQAKSGKLRREAETGTTPRRPGLRIAAKKDDRAKQ